MKIVVMFFLSLTVALAASPAWSSQFPEDIPLALEELKLVSPGADDVPGKNFSGVFVGQWRKPKGAETLNHVLAVEEIGEGERGTKVMYAFGDQPQWKIKRGKFRIRGTLKAPDQLELKFKDGAVVTYTIQPDGSLRGAYLFRGETSTGTFRRIEPSR